MTQILNTKTGVGAGLGGALGFFFMGGPVGGALGALVGGLVGNAASRGVAGFSSEPAQKMMTPKMRAIYVRAVERMADPQSLRNMADAYAKEGFHGEAILLRERANSRELPEAAQEIRREAFRKAMSSDNAPAIENLANEFLRKGCFKTYATLKAHAEAVRAAHAAGESANAQGVELLGAWAQKLSLALKHFGPGSQQARSAARNLIRARGMRATEAGVQETIALAMAALVPAPAAGGGAPPAEVAATTGGTVTEAEGAMTEAPAEGTPAPAEGEEAAGEGEETSGEAREVAGEEASAGEATEGMPAEAPAGEAPEGAAQIPEPPPEEEPDEEEEPPRMRVVQ